VIGDGVTFFTPYSGVSVTVAKAENFHSAWAYSVFGTGNSLSAVDRKLVYDRIDRAKRTTQ